MAKVKMVNKSRNEYECSKCKNKIEKGSAYQSIKFAYRPIIIRCVKCGFERCETVQSPYLQRLYYIQDNFSAESQDDIDNLVSDLEELAEETRDKFDNMPEGLQQGDSGQILETRADSLDDAISEIENLEYPDSVDDIRDEEEKYEDETDEEYEERLEALLEEKKQEICDEISDIVNSIEE